MEIEGLTGLNYFFRGASFFGVIDIAARPAVIFGVVKRGDSSAGAGIRCVLEKANSYPFPKTTLECA